MSLKQPPKTECHIKKFNKHCLLLSGCVFLFALALISRLLYLQLAHHQSYSTQSRHNYLNTMAIPASRGTITDRYGVVIATNKTSYNLNIIPGKANHIEQIIKTLKPIIHLTQQQEHQILQKTKSQYLYAPVMIKTELTETEIAKYYLNSYLLPGVNLQKETLRSYPYKDLFTDILGYVGHINHNELKTVDKKQYTVSDYIGKTGIEQTYEEQLHGKIGAEKAEINANGHIVHTLNQTLPTQGDTIKLTIDAKLQKIAYQALGDNAGALVAINPKNGDILAMVSKPSFDPNIFVDGISNKAYAELSHNPKHPLFNRAMHGLYSPGSTIKPFIALAALNDHTIEVTDKIKDPGWFRLPNTTHVYRDWKADGHGWVDITKAIIVSCDTYFYNLAVKMGISKIDQALHLFGFGQTTGVDIYGELKGNVPSPEWKMKHSATPWYTGDTVITGIGQGGLLVTPLQLANATSIIAMKGEQHQPHIIATITPHEKGKPTLQPQLTSSTIHLESPSTWNTIISAMQGVITNPEGSAELFGRHPAFSVAAKTGTAQIYGHHRNEEYSRMSIPYKLRNNHLFITFAPVEQPQLALAVVIEHAGTADIVAKKVYDGFFSLQKSRQAIKKKQSDLKDQTHETPPP